MLKIDLESLSQHTKGNAKPPVHLWQPELSGDIDIVIKADGSWWHEGTQMQRLALIKLFASILKREGDEYFLVTPVEKWRLQVEDMPILGASLLTDVEGEIAVLTNTEQRVVINNAQPLCLSALKDGLQKPYIAMADGLDIRIARQVYYQMVELAQIRTTSGDEQEAVIASAGQHFSLGAC